MGLRRPVVASFLAAFALAACGGSDESSPGTSPDFRVGDPGPIHVHGLGVNPADNALFIATHTGLFRSAEGQTNAKRVGEGMQDTMGFTVVAANRFLGSGHPDGRSNQPPFLGLISSTNGGLSWRPISLVGKRDFHGLDAAGERIYGYGTDFQSRKAGLLVSIDGGKTWSPRRAPEPLLALTTGSESPGRVLAGGEKATWRSEDGGSSWKRLPGPGGLVASGEDKQYRVTFDGEVSVSSDNGSRWRETGGTGGEPAAFEFSGDALYVALHDGTIRRSTNDGRTWRLRSQP